MKQKPSFVVFSCITHSLAYDFAILTLFMDKYTITNRMICRQCTIYKWTNFLLCFFF